MEERDAVEMLQYFQRMEGLLINIKENILTLTNNSAIINRNILAIHEILQDEFGTSEHQTEQLRPR
jgi:hypothetical protein